MKKRRREGFVTGAHLLRRVLLRRRQFQSRFTPPLVAGAGAALLLFSLVSFLPSPPPPLAADFHLRRHYRLGSSNNGVELRFKSDPNAPFGVPTRRKSLVRDIWSSRLSKFYYGCSNANSTFKTADKKTHPNRYLMIATSGGLNQQRTGITDAVVAAYILNATLVVPKLDQKSVWNDASNFSEIFDVDWFATSLSKDIKIVKQLPGKDGNKKDLKPYHTRVPRKCTTTCYLKRILPIFNKTHVVLLTKFDYRLSNKLDANLQKLRCRVNYHALKFTEPLLQMGQKLVERMRMKSKHFIALHLRFESDMLAFSGCYYGGGDKEMMELREIRRRWKTLHKSNPEKERRHGKCPLTPEEVGLMLRALGFGSDVHIYVASGDVYGGEDTLAPLRALFPNFHSKDTLASKEELAPFLAFSSRMAALDFIVCDESDVFATNNNGNMAKMLAGRRRYFGHKPTIRPNAKRLYKLFMNRNNMTWESFVSNVQSSQVGFMGEPNEVSSGKGEFHENPSDCICEDSEAKAREPADPIISKTGKEDSARIDVDESLDGQFAGDEADWSDLDYIENHNEHQRKGWSSFATDLYSSVPRLEQPELDEIFSD